MVRLQSEPIRVDELVGAVRGDGNGAVALFMGTVRDRNRGRRVLHLEYQAYDGMAEAEMKRIAQDARQRFEISTVAVAHRVGRLEIGEVSVAVAVGAPHRDAAFRACRHVIDTLKQTVPIWKKEWFEGGEEWIEGPDDAQPKSSSSSSSSSMPK